MQLQQATLQLKDQLSKGAAIEKSKKPNKEIVRALQILLYDLGFGRELNWDKYRADGGYGRSTTAAVNAFRHKNDFAGRGEIVEPPLLQLMILRQETLPPLRELKDKMNQHRLSDISNESMAQLLSAVGIDVQATNVQAALETFASRLGTSLSGGVLNSMLAQALMSQLGKLYGEGWETAGQKTNNLRLGSQLTQIPRANGMKVMDDWLSVNFTKAKAGIYTFGGATPTDFIQQNRQTLVEKGLTESTVRVLLPVSANEGNLDAINTWDDSFMTFGMFQWTLGQRENAGELAGLLQRVKDEAPNAFQENFAIHGLDVVDARKTVGYLSFGGQKIKTTFQKSTFRTPEWAFRFWKAGLDPWVQLIQVKHAADRINSFRDHPDYMPLDKYKIEEVITSEYGICLILDHSVNRPGHLMRYAIGRKDIIGQAMKHAGLAESDPSKWSTTEEIKLINAYLPLRAASSMTHGKERADKILLAVNNGQLSRERNSFQMPKPVATRGLDSNDEYLRIDPQEYESRGLSGPRPREVSYINRFLSWLGLRR